MDFFDRALHYLGQNNKKGSVFAVNIGSMDGVKFDELYSYKDLYSFKGLYVEPIPYLFDRLKNNIGPDDLCENSAITDYNGEIEMLTIEQYAIDNKLVHECFYGMSAIYPPKNGLGSEGDKKTVEMYGKIVKVPCITFEALAKKHKVEKIDILKIDAEGHDYKIFKQIDLEKYKPDVIRLEWISLTEEEKKDILDIFKKSNYKYEILNQDIVALSNSLLTEMNNKLKIKKNTKHSKKSITLVTGLWNIGRSDLHAGWSRSYQDYLNQFGKLLDIDANMIIFGDAELQDYVFQKRDNFNTQFILRNLDWFKNNDYYDKIQKIRTNQDWYQQIGWLEQSTQARLEMYNPLVMSKMFLLNDAQILDKFNSDTLFWIDAGLTFTVHPGYFTHDKVLTKLSRYVYDFTFITFPYETNSEIHGFKFDKICDYADSKVNKVARGGFFGGPKNIISQLNSIYYNLLIDTLSNDLMGTEESLFTIMVYKYPEIINFIEIEDNGLLGTFFENLKNDNIVVKSINTNNIDTCINTDENTNNTNNTNNINNINNVNNISNVIEKTKIETHLYVLTFNFPDQFEYLLQSFEKTDPNFLTKPKKFLLNNSTDRSTDKKYDDLCEKYDFEQIKKDNIGICRGRQFVSDHFQESGADYYIFFEDDMLLYTDNDNNTCKNGFKRFTSNMYDKTLKIMQKENYDYLKLSYTEFYGDNGTQFAWYNVPDNVRQKYFPNKTKKPKAGLDPNAPLTNIKYIKNYDHISYAEGEIYYSNWPAWFSKEGDAKVFNPRFDHPFEQTWMSLVFQKQKNNLINAAVLLLSPINHNRVFYYKAEERKEN